ncbi:MAG: helix-turn-helix domain-containing protein [Rikenellaceae bacterium]
MYICKMLNGINYIAGRTSDFDEFREGIPVRLEAGGFLICTSGSSDVVIDSRQYSIKPWDMMVALPNSYTQAIHVSDDFDGVIFGVDFDTLINADLSNKGFYITSINNNPSISLKKKEAQKILFLRDTFLRESANIEHPLRKEIDESILKIIIYEIAALFNNSKPNIERERSRDDIIFHTFVAQLYNDDLYNRNLDYFAQMQSITPSHLSKVVKRVSNKTASEWISQYIIISIRRLLQNEDLSIATIADHLHFPNASFLSQYFKKHTSQTPKEYRSDFFNR